MNSLEPRSSSAGLDPLVCRRALPILSVALFVAFAGIIWWLSNGGVVASIDGFDPLRYEYLARDGVPDELFFSSTYRIVFLLQYLYELLPYYFGYLIFVFFLMHFSLQFSKGTQSEVLLPIMLFSPISFYYIAQTGKDWLSILSLCTVFCALLGKNNIRFLLLVIVIAMLAIYIRPGLIPILAILVVSAKSGIRLGAIVAIVFSVLFLSNEDLLIILEQLEGTVQQEGSGELIRQYREWTFGYELMPIVLKFFLYLMSVFFQPILGGVKVFSSTDGGYYLYFETLCLWGFLIQIIRAKIIGVFVYYSVPFCILVSALSPFYHFRYLMIIYPLILGMVLLKRNQINKPKMAYQ